MKKIIAAIFIIGFILSFYGQSLAYNARDDRVPLQSQRLLTMRGLFPADDIYYGRFTIDYSQNYRKPEISYKVIRNDIDIISNYSARTCSTRMPHRDSKDYYVNVIADLKLNIINPDLRRKIKRCYIGYQNTCHEALYSVPNESWREIKINSQQIDCSSSIIFRRDSLLNYQNIGKIHLMIVMYPGKFE